MKPIFPFSFPSLRKTDVRGQPVAKEERIEEVCDRARSIEIQLSGISLDGHLNSRLVNTSPLIGFLPGCCLGSDEYHQNRIENQKPHDKEERAAFMVQLAIEPLGVIIDGKIRQSGDAYRILEKQNRHGDDHENAPSPQ